MTPRVPIGSAWTLDEPWQTISRIGAQGRIDARRSAGSTNLRRADTDVLTIDLEGVASEVAFCRLFNVWPDLTVGDVCDWDVTLPGGWRVDVKTTNYRTGRLLVHPNKAGKRIDLDALMVGTFPGPYVFRGFIRHADACQPCRLEDVGRGINYVVTQGELCDLAAILGADR